MYQIQCVDNNKAKHKFNSFICLVIIIFINVIIINSIL